ncbi:hypothetical protein U5A82_13200 [Sphingobium sp. CR2-8]|uniref:hypothetical protein n=1 Tax=Sphingobium sp. CR2-8 TaxID=1306534 RepID=UPI002DB7ECDA|nr:hypothetical protein [Sphingobium sp. CR2-8]MEC3911381.1 hypothetical protein [Sphingobium sp. CR2-8]
MRTWRNDRWRRDIDHASLQGRRIEPHIQIACRIDVAGTKAFAQYGDRRDAVMPAQGGGKIRHGFAPAHYRGFRQQHQRRAAIRACQTRCPGRSHAKGCHIVARHGRKQGEVEQRRTDRLE